MALSLPLTKYRTVVPEDAALYGGRDRWALSSILGHGGGWRINRPDLLIHVSILFSQAYLLGQTHIMIWPTDELLTAFEEHEVTEFRHCVTLYIEYNLDRS